MALGLIPNAWGYKIDLRDFDHQKTFSNLSLSNISCFLLSTAAWKGFSISWQFISEERISQHYHIFHFPVKAQQLLQLSIFGYFYWHRLFFCWQIPDDNSQRHGICVSIVTRSIVIGLEKSPFDCLSFLLSAFPLTSMYHCGWIVWSLNEKNLRWLDGSLKIGGETKILTI